ncbi:hypothetical protein SNE40_003062 [Patella caerulea]|uniref:Tetraspanin n=1 Tax=Patella caerulea TaxID=87958 RepID=A0AAN8Q4F1_PATCE
MAEGGCAKCSRLMLIIFNFIFWISGGAVLGTGIFILVSDELESFLATLIDMNIPLEFLYTAAYIMIAVGAFVFIAGFCGCCGAVRESSVMLGIYIFCMVIVMLGELAAGIYVAVEKGNLEKNVHDTISDSVRNYTGMGNSTVDFLQVKLHCCGADNFTDYRSSYWYTSQTQALREYVPETCCKGLGDAQNYVPFNTGLCQEEAKPGSLIPSDKREELRSKGCFPSIMDWLTSQSVILIGVGVGIALIQVLGIIFAVCLCRNRTEYYDM